MTQLPTLAEKHILYGPHKHPSKKLTKGHKVLHRNDQGHILGLLTFKDRSRLIYANGQYYVAPHQLKNV